MRRFFPFLLGALFATLVVAVPIVVAATPGPVQQMAQVSSERPGHALPPQQFEHQTAPVNVEQHGAPAPVLSAPAAQPSDPQPISVDPLSSSGLPGCEHDLTKWHGLVELNADGSIRCTYGHQHGSDPRVLDNLFGALNQQISYAWATVSPSGVPENDDTGAGVADASDGRPKIGGKHRFYKWEVVTAAQLQARRGKTCYTANTPFSIDNARMEVHADGNIGATIRFHSFYTEAELCDPNDPAYKGQVKIGGHFDYGTLQGTAADGSGEFVIPLPGDPAPGTTDASRKHGTTSDRSQPGFRGDFTWYGKHGLVSDGIREEDWGPIEPNNPGGPVLFYGQTGEPSNPTYNHGQGVSLDLLQVNVPDPSRLGVTPRADGSYDWSGTVDRNGNVVQCSTPGMDCVPAVFKNVKKGAYQVSAEDMPRWGMTNYDVVDPGTGQSLITFAN